MVKEDEKFVTLKVLNAVGSEGYLKEAADFLNL